MPEIILENKTNIVGVTVSELVKNIDERGTFTEIFRHSWFSRSSPLQWNIVSSNPNVFRGMHVHKKHSDYLTIVKGRCHFYLKDLREKSPTFEQEQEIVITEENQQGLFIPPGVAHAFYFPVLSMHVYSVSEYWNMDDELGCHFLDPNLTFNWQSREPMLSTHDQGLKTYEEVVRQVNQIEYNL